MSKVLVTGGSGFIGRRLCSKLLLSGRIIKKIVRRINENDSTEQYLCNFGVDQVSESIFDNIETIFHLAGVTHDVNTISIADKIYYDVNVAATEQLAIIAAKKGVKKFIYISSVKAGGNPNSYKCMSEDDQTEPEGIYGKTKRKAELKLLEIGRDTGMHVTIIRPSLVYGKGVKGNLHKMLSGIKKGWFPPLPENGNRRSMVHVDNLVDALLLVEIDKRSNGEIFIVTDENNYSSNELYRSMSKYLDKKPKKWVVPDFIFKFSAKFGDFVNILVPFPFNSYRYQKLLGDECFTSKKIQNLLGFKPKRTIFSNSLDLF